jgi:hypothetical protein
MKQQESCPLAANATCSLYADVIQPTNVTTPARPSGANNSTATSKPTSSGTASPTVVPAKGDASVAGVSVAAVGIFGLAALLL